MNDDRRITSGEENRQWPKLKMEIPSEKNEETDPEEKRKTDPRADARYRKQILDRKRKRERMRKILIGVMALAVALVVLLAGSGMR